MARLLRLKLTDFRTYPALTFEPGARLAVLNGPNGSGKTNLLEAVSLLAPGRGLRGARLAELAREGGQGGWAVAGRFEDAHGPFDLGTGVAAASPGARREYRLDGATPRSAAEIASRFACVWITPQMDLLFEEGASGRRRFLDRLVWALHPGHAREAAAHDTAVASRNRLLAQGRAEPAWLAGLEAAIARHAVALAAARRDFVASLNAATLPESGFPRVRLALADPIADRLGAAPALAVETSVREALATSRARDTAARSTGHGAHRADMALLSAETGESAARASTGQRKAMLLGVVLAHAALIEAARGAPPCLLLDEPLVHLDEPRRAALFAALAALSAQALLTGTDPEPFAALRGAATFWRVSRGALAPA